MKTHNILVALVMIMVSLACSKKDEAWTDEVYMLVASHYVDTPGGWIHPDKSLYVKIEGENEGWYPLYDSIQGFEYEEGFTYRLLVKRNYIPNPPADGSSIEYELIRIVEKKKADN